MPACRLLQRIDHAVREKRLQLSRRFSAGAGEVPDKLFHARRDRRQAPDAARRRRRIRAAQQHGRDDAPALSEGIPARVRRRARATVGGPDRSTTRTRTPPGCSERAAVNLESCPLPRLVRPRRVADWTTLTGLRWRTTGHRILAHRGGQPDGNRDRALTEGIAARSGWRPRQPIGPASMSECRRKSWGGRSHSERQKPRGSAGRSGGRCHPHRCSESARRRRSHLPPGGFPAAGGSFPAARS
jgi:hypothetical protein